MLQLFTSHCAPDGTGAAVPPAKLTVAQLRAALKARGLVTPGGKPALVARLEEAVAAEQGVKVEAKEDRDEPEASQEPAAILTPAAKVPYLIVTFKSLN